MILAAWMGHSPRSQAIAQCVRDSFKALGWKDEYAASLMKLANAPQLSRQLAGIEPLNLWRLADLPDAFWQEYDRRRVGLRGGVVLEAPDLSLIRGACVLGSKSMARFTTPHEAKSAERQHA